MTAKVRPLFSDSQQPGRARPLPLQPSEQALRAAAQAGWEDGERAGYMRGWRWGLVCGAVAGGLLGGFVVAGAFLLGMAVGAAP